MNIVNRKDDWVRADGCECAETFPKQANEHSRRVLLGELRLTGTYVAVKIKEAEKQLRGMPKEAPRKRLIRHKMLFTARSTMFHFLTAIGSSH